MKEQLTALILAIVSSLVLFTYMMKLPHVVMPRHSEIINEYYYDNMFPNALLDVGFIVIYIGIAMYLCKIISAESHIEPLIVALVTSLLTASFCFSFNLAEKNEDNFFSKWFHEVKYKSVIYDVILVVMTFIMYKYLLSLIK